RAVARLDRLRPPAGIWFLARASVFQCETYAKEVNAVLRLRGLGAANALDMERLNASNHSRGDIWRTKSRFWTIRRRRKSRITFATTKASSGCSSGARSSA